MKVALISTTDSPMAPFYLKEILSVLPSSTHIIYDSNKKKKHMKEVWNQRTNFYFENKLGNLFDNYGHILKKAKIHYVSSHNNNKMKQILINEKFDYLINAGTQLKIKKTIIDKVKIGIINIHPGILPNYRGCTCVEWAIYNDEKIGNTIHLMSSNYDSGEIIKIQKYVFKKSDTYIDIRLKVYLKGIKLLRNIIQNIKKGNINKSNFIKQNKNEGKYWKPISKDKMKKVLSKIVKKKYKYQI